LSCLLDPPGRPLLTANHPKAIKPINVTNKKVRKTGIKIKDKSTGKLVDVAVLSEMNKRACEVIFSAYWYGWEHGCPPIFTELFKEYGNFQPGALQARKRKIDVSKNPHWTTMAKIYDMEKSNPLALKELKKSISLSPEFSDKQFDIDISDLVQMVKLNGQSFTFKEKQKGIWEYEDKSGVIRQLPAWAIS
jgi:hypothetical protein|tara:strand:- start:375 stop:947 length:573 start_codon:yes stop_codon:yes gene_type:complete